MLTSLFVFGTLKEGFPNHPINRGKRVAGGFKTMTAFPLYLMGARHTPWMLDAPGEGFPVVGELYEVDERTLEDMDRLERVNQPDGYVRKQIALVPIGTTASAAPVSAHAYLKRRDEFSPTDARLGPIPEYTLAHAALYRKREA